MRPAAEITRVAVLRQEFPEVQARSGATSCGHTLGLVFLRTSWHIQQEALDEPSDVLLKLGVLAANVRGHLRKMYCRPILML